MVKFMKRFAPLAVIVLGIAIVYFTGVYRYLSFQSLKDNHELLQNFVEKYPIAVPCIFVITYIVCIALSIPGAIFLSLLGGYLFPQPLSAIYVICAATCGACIVFLAARTALGDTLRKKAGPFLKKMEAGFHKNAISYLLFLRFVPLFPFWMINLAAAFFGVSLITFAWTTLVGIIPGACFYTLIGSGLGTVFESKNPLSVESIFNIKIKIALVLLGFLALTPILIKKNHK